MYLRLLNIYLFKNILTSSINRFVSGKWHNNGFSFLQNNKDDADDKSLFMITIKIFRHEYYASLAKWLRVRLRTKWLWVRIPLLSLKLQIWRLLLARSFLTFRRTAECGFTLNLVRDMIIAYSQPGNFLSKWWRNYWGKYFWKLRFNLTVYEKVK